VSEHQLVEIVTVNSNGTVDLRPVGSIGAPRWPQVPVGGAAQLSPGHLVPVTFLGGDGMAPRVGVQGAGTTWFNGA